jgi:xanthine dehydrogenase molybdopterin-binding subunit B
MKDKGASSCTEISAFGFGTFASRSMVMAGGAVARAARTLRDKLTRIGAHSLQVDPAEVRYADGAVWGPQGSVTVDEIAKVAHLRMDGLPPGVDPLLDATATYEPAIGTGVFSYATHGAVVAVDPETGFVEILDFAVAEDCGTMINPMISKARSGAASCRASAPPFTKKYPTMKPASRLPALWPITCCRVRPKCRRSRSAISTHPRRIPNTA